MGPIALLPCFLFHQHRWLLPGHRSPFPRPLSRIPLSWTICRHLVWPILPSYFSEVFLIAKVCAILAPFLGHWSTIFLFLEWTGPLSFWRPSEQCLRSRLILVSLSPIFSFWRSSVACWSSAACGSAPFCVSRYRWWWFKIDYQDFHMVL